MALDTEKIAQNATFTVLVRIGMAAVIMVGLPIAGFMLNRVVTTADEISAKVGAQGTKLELLDQSVKFGFEAAKGDINGMRLQLTDHEGRIRVIESRAPR